MTARIQKILAQRGIASRRHAEAIIEAGRVTCNGRVCVLGDSADPDRDEILLDGKPLPSNQSKVYLMLHKPRGYVTTLSDERGRKDVSMLVSECGQRVYPVGRLDMDSEGLLLMTNDGDFANRLMHPKHEIEKTYRVSVADYDPHKLARLTRPVELDGYTIRPPKVELVACSKNYGEILVTIHEGRNRQVRRMCAMAGMSVERLIRIREGSVELGALPVGKWRYLTEEEISALGG